MSSPGAAWAGWTRTAITENSGAARELRFYNTEKSLCWRATSVIAQCIISSDSRIQSGKTQVFKNNGILNQMATLLWLGIAVTSSWEEPVGSVSISSEPSHGERGASSCRVLQGDRQRLLPSRDKPRATACSPQAPIYSSCPWSLLPEEGSHAAQASTLSRTACYYTASLPSAQGNSSFFPLKRLRGLSMYWS